MENILDGCVLWQSSIGYFYLGLEDLSFDVWFVGFVM